MAHTAANEFGIAPGESAFIIHAHPDDEAVLTGSAVMRLALSGVVIHGVAGSDGELSTKSPDFSRKGLRVAELIAAYNILGKIPEGRIHRLGLPDGSLPENRYVAARKIAELIDLYNPAALITAGPNGFGHPDHSAMHKAAVIACRMSDISRGVSPSLWALQENGTGHVSVASDYDTKMRAVLAHESQMPGSILDTGEIILADRTRKELQQYAQLLHVEETYSQIN